MIISFPSDPSNFITLSPVFYSPDDDAPKLSTGALKKTGLFKQITEHRHGRLTLTTMKGIQIEEPTIQKDLIDYVKIYLSWWAPLETSPSCVSHLPPTKMP